MSTPQEDSEAYARENYDTSNINHPDHPGYRYTGPSSYSESNDPDRSNPDSDESVQEQNFQEQADGSHSGFREESVGEIAETDDFSETVQQKESHSGFRSAESRSKTVRPSHSGFRKAESKTVRPSHSGFRKAESNPVKEFFADPLPTFDNSESQDHKDERWYEPFPPHMQRNQNQHYNKPSHQTPEPNAQELMTVTPYILMRKDVLCQLAEFQLKQKTILTKPHHGIKGVIEQDR